MLGLALLAAVLVQLAGRVAGWPLPSDRLVPGRLGPFARSAVRLWLGFGLTAMAGLLLLGRGTAAANLPSEFTSAAARVGRVDAVPVLVGLLTGVAVGAVIAWIGQRRGRRGWVIGRAPRLPKTARELPGAAVLAVSAAVTEELYFRLLLPLLLVPLIGATAAFVAAALLFGAVHRHQGTAGMVATGLVGLALAGLYLGTGALWMAMMAHAILDLNALVLRPAIAFSSRGNP